MRIIGEVLLIAITTAWWLLIARAVISWVALLTPNIRLPRFIVYIFGFVSRVTEPPIAWLRRYIRPVGLGTISLDLSFMVWFVVLLLAQRIVDVVFF